jgi:hypothetical protein
MSDPAEEQISHSDEDHGLGDVEALLVIADQPALCISSPSGLPNLVSLSSRRSYYSAAERDGTPGSSR